VRLQYAIEAGDAEFWITHVVAQCVSDGRTNHGERVRHNYYAVYTMKELFEAVSVLQIIDFIKDVNFCFRI